MRIPFARLQAEFRRVLLSNGFTDDKAARLSEIFAQNSLDGIYTHGLNRFPVFIEYVKDGLVNKDADPVLVAGYGAIEQWDGGLGPGPLNAAFSVNRAIGLAEVNGIGCVALRNTNHWMRGGTYGWQAASAGCIGICFTNTMALMPPWGGKDARLGNNPLVIAVPRSEGHIVLDMAMSQYSFGKLGEYAKNGEQTEHPAGYDGDGKLSQDPQTVLDSKLGLPIGFWKGSGLSLMLDLLATVLSGGRSTGEITRTKKEWGVSQVFLCIKNAGTDVAEKTIEQVLAYTGSSRSSGSRPVAYPGENTLNTRLENLEKGIPVDENIWKKVCGL